MKPRVVASVLVLLPTISFAAPPRPSPDEHRPGLPQVIHVIDNSQRSDVNQLSMVVTNTGSFAFDKITGSAGLEFPRGSGHTVVFAGGLWMGAQVNGQTRLAIS